MTTFSHILRDFYERTPERIAVYLQQAGQDDLPVSYRDLLRGAAGAASTFAQRGVLPGEVVLLILQHGSDLIYSYFGAVLHGAIPSIMPYLTEKLLPERYRADLASLVSITRPAVIVTYPEFESEVKAALKQGDSVREVILSSGIGDASDLEFQAMPGLHCRPSDIALLQHSSGTTGLQKGVALSHQAVINQLESYRLALRISDLDVIVSWLPLYHDMGLIACYLMPILLGVPLVLMSPFDWVRAPHRLFQAVSRYKGTLSWLPNFAYNFCAQKVRERDLEGADLSSWRSISNCSEPMRWESHQVFYERFKDYGLRYDALNTCYAMAENVFAVTQGGVDAPVFVDLIDRESLQVERLARPAADGRESLKMLSAGRPIRNVEVKVLDEKGREVPERQVGELALKSDSMLTGYFNRPDATARAFHNGWYMTGDFGYLAGGEVFVTGRKKDLIIVGGKNIYPQDIEQLAMEVPGIHPGRVVCFGVFNETAGTEDVVVVAEVDTNNEQEGYRISDEVRKVVTRGSAIALRQVYLVSPPWLAKTSSGKIARLANRDKYLAETQSC